MASFLNHSADEAIQAQLLANRAAMSSEMRLALACKTAVEKRRLVARWEQQYSERMCRDLLACARDKKVAFSISRWDLAKL